MKMYFLLFLITGFPMLLMAQQAEYQTLFIPQTVTYNGSPDPNECWESVDQGILVQVGEQQLFFLLPAGVFERLKNQLVNQQVLVEVVYFDERTDESGASGSVLKITHQGVVVFPAN
ncbi:MAG: hypothetical protein HYZ14_05050 [Bacteroidetes bacterium]|nr:hypothetical protein [Bacteroidota bacterium]